MVKLQAGHMHHNIGVENTLTPRKYLKDMSEVLVVPEMVARFGFGVPEL